MFKQAIQNATHRYGYLVLPAAVALAWVATAIAQRFESPPLGAEIAATALAIPLTHWAFSKHLLNRKELRYLIPMGAPVLLMLASAILSDDIRDALLGAPPLWQGWLLWASVLGWLITTYVGSDWHDLIAVTRVLTAAGTIAALWAIAEWAGLLTPYDSIMGPAMALFDNPLSMGQALTVTIAATLSLAVRHIAMPRWQRIALVLSALVQTGAIVAAGSLGPLVALVFGCAAYGVTETGRSRTARAVFAASVSVVVVLILAFVLLCAAWAGAFGTKTFLQADRIMNNRLSVWTDVAERTARHPTMGTGPSQFDSVVDWTVLPDGRVDVWFTYDQHSILLTWLMDVGFLGFAVFGLAAVVIGVRLIRAARASTAAHPIRVLAAGCVATFVAMLSSWPDPLTLLSITVIVGCIVSPYRSRKTHQPEAPYTRGIVGLVAPGAITGAVLLLVLLSLSPDIVAQYRITEAESSDDMLFAFSDALAKTDDPFYLEEELFVINAAGEKVISDDSAVELIRSLDETYPRHALHRVDVPLLALEILWQRSDDLSPDEYWELSRAFAQRGITADPDLSVWRYALARSAVTAGRPDAEEYISAALRTDVSPEARELLESWRDGLR